MDIQRKIDRLGRIVLPMDFRKALGLEGEAEVVIGLCGDTITVKGKETFCKLCGTRVAISELKVCGDCIGRIREYNR